MDVPKVIDDGPAFLPDRLDTWGRSERAEDGVEAVLSLGAAEDQSNGSDRNSPESYWRDPEPYAWSLLPLSPAPSRFLNVSAVGDGPGPRHRTRHVLAMSLVLVLLGSAVAGWAVARQQNAVASRWQHIAQDASASNRKLSGDLETARGTIHNLDGQVEVVTGQLSGTRHQLSDAQRRLGATERHLNGTESSLSGTEKQLSTVATQKEREKDQNTVLQALIASAGRVSAKLESCVTDLDTVWSQLIDDIDYGTVNEDPTIDADVQTVVSECQGAEQANSELQAIVSANTGQ